MRNTHDHREGVILKLRLPLRVVYARHTRPSMLRNRLRQWRLRFVFNRRKPPNLEKKNKTDRTKQTKGKKRKKKWLVIEAAIGMQPIFLFFFFLNKRIEFRCNFLTQLRLFPIQKLTFVSDGLTAKIQSQPVDTVFIYILHQITRWSV